jgi:hypothetical protein
MNKNQLVPYSQYNFFNTISLQYAYYKSYMSTITRLAYRKYLRLAWLIFFVSGIILTPNKVSTILLRTQLNDFNNHYG